MNINEIPFAEWLEDGLRTIFESGTDKIALCALMPDGIVLTGYHNLCTQDKAIIAHNIQSDITMDVVLANIDQIRDALEGVI